jgi:sugar O-acyltransferase (sialic acid O-acetyltransferase NeuD family)
VKKNNEGGILIVGAGGHAFSCLDVIKAQAKYEVVGFVGKPDELGTKIGGYAVLFCDDGLEEAISLAENFLIGIGQIKTAETRRRLFDKIQGIGGKLPVIVSSKGYVSPNAEVGPGTIVHHGAVVNAGAIIGANCIINTGAFVEHGAIIGDHCHISTGAMVNGDVEIGTESFVGSGAIIKQGIRVGSHSVVGMGAVVKTNLPERAWVGTGVNRK